MLSVVLCKQEDNEKEILHKKFEPYIEVFEKSLNLNFILRIIFSLFNTFSFILMNYIIYKEYLKKTITREGFISSFIVTYSILSIFSEGYYAIRSIINMYSQIEDMEHFFNNKMHHCVDDDESHVSSSRGQVDDKSLHKTKRKRRRFDKTIQLHNVSYSFKSDDANDTNDTNNTNDTSNTNDTNNIQKKQIQSFSQKMSTLPFTKMTTSQLLVKSGVVNLHLLSF